MDAFAQTFADRVNILLLDNSGAPTAPRRLLPANVRLVCLTPSGPELPPSAPVGRDRKDDLGWQLNPQHPQAGQDPCVQRIVRRAVLSFQGPQPGIQLPLVLACGIAKACMLSNRGQIGIVRSAPTGVMLREVPQQLELMGNKRADGLRQLLEIVWEIAQVLHGLEEHSHPVSIHIPPAAIHQGAFGCTQEKVFEAFFMGIRRSERRIVACHTHLTATTGSISQKSENR
jgi:hypothetical protein